jgi:uncharacterized Tic20 family protein
MVNRLPAWFFLSLSLLLLGLAFFPIFRVILGIDAKIGVQFWTVVMLVIGGLMSGLTAMILLVRRQPKIDWSDDATTELLDTKTTLVSLHACGLLLYSGIPLLNFLAAYWIWAQNRHTSKDIDSVGREVLDFQITIYLYLLLSLFLVFAVLGLVTTPLILVFHGLSTLMATIVSLNGKKFHYVANIPITLGRPTKPKPMSSP